MYRQQYVALRPINLGYPVAVGDLVDVTGLRALTVRSLINSRKMVPVTDIIATQIREDKARKEAQKDADLQTLREREAETASETPDVAGGTPPPAKRKYLSQAEIQQQMKGAR